MRETSFSIASADKNKSIYGTLSQKKDSSDKLAILAHGLTGNPFEYLHMIARDELISYGYDVCQFWFYGCEPDSRKLHECTLKTHAQDLQSVSSHFKDSYEKIFVAGHSYGGLTTLICNSPDFTAVSLWDPSFKPDRSTDLLGEISEFNAFINDGHYYGLIGKDMVEEAENTSPEEWEKIARSFSTPCQVVLADPEKTFIINDLTDHLSVKSLDIQKIPGADHCFIENATAPKLAVHCRKWFDRF